MSQFCQYKDHDESQIIRAYLKIDCKYSRSFCHHCILKHHISHNDDLKAFKQLNEWIKLQMDSYQDLTQIINEIIQLNRELSKFLISINRNQQMDYSQVSQQIMNDEINKLIQIQLKVLLIPLSFQIT
ncbi:unnamed protein product [Paramecium sonneborni]|uniref:Uncharacterized protein n=1 Tax=Paramecium sonneborni TaxID=65129 RepID=A0A8S1RUC9_9CILI|nr:unnamed protein product [Paramecium sonneborni]